MPWINLYFAGPRTIHFVWTVNPKNFLEDTPKAFFKGFILRLYCLHLTIFRWFYVTIDFLELYNTIINLIFQEIMNISWKIAECISCTSNFESERHDNVMKIVHRSPKVIVFCIKRVHLDLAAETIKEGKHLVSSSGATNMSMVGNENLIFWTRFGEITEVKAAANLIIFLLNRHNINQLGRVLYMLDTSNNFLTPCLDAPRPLAWSSSRSVHWPRSLSDSKWMHVQ